MSRKIIGSIIVIVAVAALSLLLYYGDSHDIVGEVHEHADFKVYIAGQEFNFSQSRYMSNESNMLSNFAHLHDMDGTVMHKHASGITLGFFFRSIGMNFTDECLTIENSTYCANDPGELRMYVQEHGKEWKQNSKLGEYEFKDLDRILIAYDWKTEAELEREMNSVTDAACIHSGLCPERGLPGNESSCLTGQNCIIE